MNKQVKTALKKITPSFQKQPQTSFDPSKDKCLSSIVIESGEKIKYTVGVYSYNNGEPKVGFNKQYLNAKGEWSSSGIGRLTQSDAIAVAKAIVKLIGGK